MLLLSVSIVRDKNYDLTERVFLDPTLTLRPPRFVRCALLLVLTPQGFHKRAHLTKVGVEAWHHAVFASTHHP